MKFSVGLTGGIGSGKSTVADLFAQHGVSIIDTDAIAHALTAPGGAAIPMLHHQFGPDFIDVEGALDRKKMREHVFTDATARLKLESILHPLIRQETLRAASASVSAYHMFVVPLLVESPDWAKRVTRVLVVDVPEEIQIERVMRRSALSREQVQAIMAAQAPRQVRLSAAHDVINNTAAPDALISRIAQLHQQYLQLAAKYCKQV